MAEKRHTALGHDQPVRIGIRSTQPFPPKGEDVNLKHALSDYPEIGMSQDFDR